MKLYFMPGACSLAPHIALREASLPFSLIEVDYRTRRTKGGGDYNAINFKGYVPALELETGDILTEVPVILQYVDGRVPEAGLLPASGIHRLRSLEWLNFIATEIHKSFSPLFRPTTPDSFFLPGRQHLRRRLAIVEDHLRGQAYLSGAGFSLPDIYLFVVCRWLSDQDMDVEEWPALQRHSDAISMRAAVRQALAEEGLA
ncbi:glutathione transferase GstA [Roseovarius sp.]|uniref:glutathione transferase GstA n=1 Tax=Roseovarius sp. TaxID=1486281 RepID=UPI0025F47FE2|nr:glutathione transferase GstA [Roseovarius sp.]